MAIPVFSPKKIVWSVLLLSLSFWSSAAEAGNAGPVSDYHLADKELKISLIDSDPAESFLSLQLDSAGRLFAGGREALFVYDPAPGGLYKPRQLLYRFPKNSWIYGIAIRGEDVYVSTHTAIYVIPGGVLKRSGLQPKRLVWGMPMLPYFEEHQGIHALAFGPDGDLYFSVGDNLVGYGDFKRADHWGHWNFYHGTHQTEVTTVGLVAKVSPDGEKFTVISRGLRNCCGLAFDSEWNLFGNDNDHESLPANFVPGRLLNITPHSYFSWPRGWLQEKQPWRADLLATLNPNLGRYVPTGQAYYNESFLPERFRNNLLVTEWGKGALLRYPLKNEGASFHAEEISFLNCANNLRPVGVAVGRGGRIFISSLLMAGNEASPLSRSEIVMVTRADDSSGSPFVPYEETQVPLDKLFSELSSNSSHANYRAHLELMRRGGDVATEASHRLAKAAPGSPLQVSLLWLSATTATSVNTSKLLVTDANDKTRLQALRALYRFGDSQENCAVYQKALSDSNPQIVHDALSALFDGCTELPFDGISQLAEGSDSFIRQTAVQLLSEKASLPYLQKLSESTNASTRLAGVLALGFRLTLPNATKPLPQDYVLNARGFNARVQYAEGIEDLSTLGKLGVFTLADAWARHTKTAEEETLFGILQRRLDDAENRVAMQSAFFLRILKDARVDAKASSLLGISTQRSTNTPIANARSTGLMDLPPEFSSQDWTQDVKKGDAKRGRELFNSRGCAVCHQILPEDKGGGGPSLVGVGGRFSIAYLVESVVTPNKTVAPMFRWTSVQLKGDDEVAGLVTGETSYEVDLLLPAGIHRLVKKSDILKREIQDRSPMPEGLIQNANELRDLLAFLLSQK